MAPVFAVRFDVDRGWETIGPYALHDASEYARWAVDGGVSTGYESAVGDAEPAGDAAGLRAGGHYRAVTPDALVDELAAAPVPFVMLHPMMGGIPPALAWESLRQFERSVLVTR